MKALRFLPFFLGCCLFLFWIEGNLEIRQATASTAKSVGKSVTITTYDGRVLVGSILAELKTGYLLKLDERTLLLPYRMIKNLIFKGLKQPFAKPTLKEQPSTKPFLKENPKKPKILKKPVKKIIAKPKPLREVIIEPKPRVNGKETFRVVESDEKREMRLFYARKIFNQQKKSTATHLALNIFLPFAIGSFLAGDQIGVVLGLGGQLGGVALVFIAFLNPSGSLNLILSVAVGLIFAGRIAPCFTTYIFDSEHNDMLKERIYRKHIPGYGEPTGDIRSTRPLKIPSFFAFRF